MKILTMKNLAALAFLTLLSGTALAAPASSDVNLGGGNIGPAKYLSLSLVKLVPYATYHLTCSIRDDNVVKNPAMIRFKALGTINFDHLTLNGNPISDQVKLTNLSNTFEADIISGSIDGNFIIYNLDQADTITVDNCFATAVTNK